MGTAKSPLPHFIHERYVPDHSNPVQVGDKFVRGVDAPDHHFDGDKFVVIGTWKDIQFMIGMTVFGMFVFCACLAAIRWKMSNPKVVYGMVNVNSDTEAIME